MSKFHDTDEGQQQIDLQTLVQEQQTHGAPTPVRSAAFTLKDSASCCAHTETQTQAQTHTHNHSHTHGSGPGQKRKQASVVEDDNDELEKSVEDDDEEGPAKRKRRKQVERACSNCRRSKTACSSERPCKRCTGHGIESTCIDAPRKRRAKKAKLSLEDQFLWHEFSKFVGDTNVRPSAFMPPKLFGADPNAVLFDAHAAAAAMHQDPDNDDTNLGTVLKKRQRTKSLVKAGETPAPAIKTEVELPSLYGSGASSPFFNAALYSGMGGLLPPHLQHLSAMGNNLNNGNNNNILMNDGSECDSANESVPEFSHLLQDLWRPLRVPVQNVDFEGQRPASSSSSSSSQNAGSVLPLASTNSAATVPQINMVPGFPAGPNPFSSSASARFPSDFFKFSASNNFLSAFGDGSQTLLASQVEGVQNPGPSASPSTNPALPPGTSPIAVNPNGTHFALSNSPKSSSITLHFGLNESPANRQSLELFFQSLLAETGSQNPGFQPVA